MAVDKTKQIFVLKELDKFDTIYFLWDGVSHYIQRQH